MAQIQMGAANQGSFTAADLEARDYPAEMRASMSALRRVIKDPTQQAALFTVFRTFPLFDVMREVTLRLPILRDPAFVRLYEAQNELDLSRAAVQRLLELPPTTLGGAFSRYCQAYNLGDSHLAYVLPPTNPSRFLIHRTCMLHDLVHFLTGYPATHVLGEIEVDAFQLAQSGAPNHTLFLAGGYANVSLKAPRNLPAAARRSAAAWRRGRRAKPLVLVDWGPLMEAPLGEVKVQLGLA